MRWDTTSLGHATVLDWFWRIRRLVQWMISQGRWRFSHLTIDDTASFLRTIEPRRGGPPEVALATVQRHINIFRCLWDMRGSLRDGLRFDINHVEHELLRELPLRRALPWRALDEADAVKLLQAAQQWTRAHAEYLGDVLGRLWAEQDRVVGLTLHQARRRREKFYAELAQEPQFVALVQMLGVVDRSAYAGLQAAVKALEGAVLTSILFLVGLRSREAVRLDADCISLPQEGEPENLLLSGIAAKKGGRPRTWAITEPVKQAVDAICLMHAAPRERSQQAALLLKNASACSLFPSSNAPARARANIVTARLRSFARVALPGEPALARRVHAHAARKTFARFVVLRDKRVLESLAYHFGHTHRAITDGYYVGADIELAVLLDGESREDLAQSLVEMLTSGSIAGKASKAFVAHRKEAVAKLRGKAALRSMVDRLIAQGVQLAPCDWGYCVYSKALSACHGDAKGPNEAKRTADVCSGCSNFVVTERHRSWWEERVSRDEAYLQGGGATDQAVMVVQRRLERSKEILADLNGSRAHARPAVDQESGT